MTGYVYFIGSPIFGWYKIGKSITPEIRIKDLGILLPFKIKILGVWEAKNHHLAETALHELYADFRINGEWFEFSKEKAWDVFSSLPAQTRIFPGPSNSTFDKFSNVDEDTKQTNHGERRVLGLRVQKLRGEFTLEEREAKRAQAIAILTKTEKRKETEEQVNNVIFSIVGTLSAP